MPTRYGSNVDEAIDGAADKAGRALSSGKSDARFLEEMGISGGLEQTPEASGAPPSSAPGPMNRALDSADGAINNLWNAQIAIPVASGAAGWLMTKGEALGPRWGAPLRGLSHVFGAPQKAMQFEVQDLPGIKSSKDIIIPAAERKFEAVGARVEEAVANRGPLHAARGVINSRYEKAALKHGKAAAKLHDEAMVRFDRAINAIPADSTQLSGVRKLLEETKAAFGTLPQNADAKTLAARAKSFGESEKAISEMIKGLKNSKTLSDVEKTALRTAEKNFSGKMMGFFGVSKKLLAAHGPLEAQEATIKNAAFAKDLKAGFKAIPKEIASLNGERLMTKGLYWGSQGVTTIRTGQLAVGGLSSVKKISADVTGADPKEVSTFKTALQLAHLAPIPEAMKEVRSQFWKSVGPRMAANLAGMAAFAKIMGRGASGKAQFIGVGVQMAASGLGEMAAGKNQIIETYHAVAEAQKQGLDVPKGAYLALVVHAHKADKLDEADPRLMVVADQYAQEKITAANVLKEIASGAFDKRLAAAVVPAAKAAEKPVVAETDAEPKPVSAVDRLQGGANASQPVVGTHTEKEVVRRLGAEQAAPSLAT